MMGKAAFIASTRQARAVMVMAASDRIDFRSPIREGEMVELTAGVQMTGRSSVRISVDLNAEDLISGERRHAATALFTMVSVDENGRAKPLGGICNMGPSPRPPNLLKRELGAGIPRRRLCGPASCGSRFPKTCSQITFPEIPHRRWSFGNDRLASMGGG
ncbi:acyl-CoA thioesterase [Sphingomonas aurantiaca]